MCDCFYKHFEIEYTSGCIFDFEPVRPIVALSINMSPDDYEICIWTHEIYLPFLTEKEKAIGIAKDWIDWVEDVIAASNYEISPYEITMMCDDDGMYVR